TLTTYARHTMAGPESSPDSPPWLRNPGRQDITAHVDFTSIRAAAEAEGMTTIGFLDQTYFLLGLMGSLGSPGSTDSPRSSRANPENPANLANPGDLRQRLALKTLLMPGGL